MYIPSQGFAPDLWSTGRSRRECLRPTQGVRTGRYKDTPDTLVVGSGVSSSLPCGTRWGALRRLGGARRVDSLSVPASDVETKDRKHCRRERPRPVQSGQRQGRRYPRDGSRVDKAYTRDEENGGTLQWFGHTQDVRQPLLDV